MLRLLTFAVLMFVAPAAVQAQDRLKVIATFSILGDVVKNIGGDRIDMNMLVGPNADAHVYSPSPADAKKLADAKLVVINGLGYEGWIGRLVRASGSKAPVVTAAKGVNPIRAAGGHGHGHSHDSDPHAWQSIANVKVYATNIRDGLIAADPAGKAAYEANAAAYLARLDELEKEVRDTVAKIPADRRKVITTHDAFGYFSAAYGVQFIAPIGAGGNAEPSAKDVAKIIAQVKRQKIPAVFLENISDQGIMQQIARETGAKIGGTLYSDALSNAGGPAATYIDMMRHNVGELAKALAN